MPRRLTEEELEELCSPPGARRVAVRNFLTSFPLRLAEMQTRMNMYYDARLWHWNSRTVQCIRLGINWAYHTPCPGHGERAKEDFVDANTGEVIVFKGEIITEEIAERIEDSKSSSADSKLAAEKVCEFINAALSLGAVVEMTDAGLVLHPPISMSIEEMERRIRNG